MLAPMHMRICENVSSVFMDSNSHACMRACTHASMCDGDGGRGKVRNDFWDCAGADPRGLLWPQLPAPNLQTPYPKDSHHSPPNPTRRDQPSCPHAYPDVGQHWCLLCARPPCESCCDVVSTRRRYPNCSSGIYVLCVVESCY